MKTRREFVQHLGFGVAGLGLMGSPLMADKLSVSPIFTIAPIKGKAYPASFLRFCLRERFSTWQQAVSSVRDATLPFQIIRSI